MKAIGIVPARSGSKGLPDKNIRRIGDRSLLELAVGVGVDCPMLDEVYISTDSADYEAMAKAAGATSLGLRPAALASDQARSVDAVIDLIRRLSAPPEAIVLLQPTAPARTPEQISAALAGLEKASAVVSVCRLEEPHPAKLKRINDQGYLVPFLDQGDSETPRQALPPVYQLTGAIYAIRTETLLHEETFFPSDTQPLVTHCGVNIDAEQDLLFLRMLWEQGRIELHGLNRG